jgi:hypothetical protein
MFKWQWLTPTPREEKNPEAALLLGISSIAATQMPRMITSLNTAIQRIVGSAGMGSSPHRDFVLLSTVWAITTGVTCSAGAYTMRRKLKDNQITGKTINSAAETICLTGIGNFINPERERLFQELQSRGQLTASLKDLNSFMIALVRPVNEGMGKVLFEEMKASEFWADQATGIVSLAGLPRSMAPAVLDAILENFMPQVSACVEEMKCACE